jgi:hypothetical protein
MPYWHSLFLIGLAWLSVFFISAPKRQPPEETAPPPVYPLRADPAAAVILDRAVTTYDADKIGWLQMTVWHQVSAEPLAFQATGTYRAGPEHRLRVELEVTCAAVRRRTQTICDGRSVWETEEAEGKPARVVKRPRKPEGAAGPENAALTPVAGPGAMLASLRREVTFTHQEEVLWRNRNVIVLTGALSQPVEGEFPAFRPRQCRLVLDAATHWPHRLEWWGPATGVSGDVRLVQIELRQPVMSKPLPDALFTYQGPEPGTAEEAAGVKPRKRGLDWSAVGFPND